MFATLCSKPAATNPVIGKIIAIILSVTVFPANVIQIAIHTKILHSTPLKIASVLDKPVFATAILTYCSAIAPSFISKCPDKKTSTAMPTAPIKFAMHTTIQFLSKSYSEIFLSAHAITIRLLPVNSSAPATTTKIRPRQKANPPNNWPLAKLREGSDFTKT